jgi:hypothetical protein
MASVSRQIGWSQESNLLYQILKQITRLTSIIFGLKPKYKVYTALLTQSGTSNPQSITSGELTIGVTYLIPSRVLPGAPDWDFTNVGASNNNVGTYFVATGTTPNAWGIYGELEYNTGAPVAIVLENTIGNIWFEYVSAGEYTVNSNDLFIEDKTAIDIDAFSYLNVGNYSFIANSTLFPENTFNITTTSAGAATDDLLLKNRLEIKVYN